jgi:hypothetical protein
VFPRRENDLNVIAGSHPDFCSDLCNRRHTLFSRTGIVLQKSCRHWLCIAAYHTIESLHAACHFLLHDHPLPVQAVCREEFRVAFTDRGGPTPIAEGCSLSHYLILPCSLSRLIDHHFLLAKAVYPKCLRLIPEVK